MKERIRPTRSGLFAIELVIAVGVFTLCAAICTGIFAQSEVMSRDSADLTRAVNEARNAAERFKASGGDLARMAERFGGRLSDNGAALSLSYDAQWTPMDTGAAYDTDTGVTNETGAAYATDAGVTYETGASAAYDTDAGVTYETGAAYDTGASAAYGTDTGAAFQIRLTPDAETPGCVSARLEAVRDDGTILLEWQIAALEAVS